MRRHLPVLLTLLALVLGGCSDGDERPAGATKAAAPKPPEVVVPEAGQCVAREVADGQDVAPDFTSVVPCTEPHAYEVISVRPVPGRFVDATSEAAAQARRTELARVDAKAPRRSRDFQAVMWPGCDQAFRVATGVDRFTFRARNAQQLKVNPLGRNVGPWLNLAPPEVWTEQPLAVCSVRYAGQPPKGAARGPLRPVTSANAQQVASTWMTPRFPQPFRLCHEIRGNRRVPCGAPHGIEYLWTVDFKAAFGKDFLGGFEDLAALPREEYDTAVSLCRRLYRQTGNRVPDGLRVNYRFNPELDDPSRRTLQMSCVLETRNGRDRLRGFTSLR